ncbi:excisionase family DNA binding protein [Halopolyspora algeriensis]|uniref:Excisionase family DNA binding protein n=1 Tax=Halopolyspora algeriensis TaxID=1500506 RepID=A0A368VYI6_9ACTN|nr:helix-turn-helix domain-containing protein [Halopolyspora algeriensis]RCW45892.1 excisionase family DNA binding protein [Halopolyspora algeriensis]TQM55306.1 excisionase family DNA binding protein [Halopolyspora algeriensis]
MSERTVLPPRRTGELSHLLSALNDTAGGAQPALVARDGSRIELPDELFEVLQDVATALSQGMAITVAPQHTVLTTSETAELLGVSRPTVVRLLESGEIPYEQPGRHRRLRLADVLAYQQRRRRSRAAGLDEMVHESEEDGIYDLPDDAVTQRSSDLSRED